MAVTLYVSPPASGKTQLAVEHIRSVLTEAPLAPVWVIVPDRLQARAFRDRLALAGGAVGAKVGTFGTVYTEILEKARKSIPVADHPILHRMIQNILEEMTQNGSITHYAALKDSPGFAKTLAERFAELKRALVWPEAFMEAVCLEEPQIVELAQIYQAYQTRMQKIHWADPEGLSWLAVEALEQDSMLVADWKLVVVDGFDDFNPTQLKALSLLALHTPEMLITLPGTLEMNRAVHKRFQLALQELQAQLNPTILTLENGPYLPAPLRALESQLLEQVQQTLPANSNLHLLEVQTPFEEAREALRWIKAQVLRCSLSLLDCAVFVPELDTYREALRTAALEFGMPIQFTQGILLADTPAVSALRAVLNLPVQDYPRRGILDCVGSPYLDFSHLGLAPEDVSVLDAASFHSQVVGGKGQWITALEGLAAVVVENPPCGDDGEDLPQPHIPRGAEAARLVHGIQSLVDRMEPGGEKSIRDWVIWLEDLLDYFYFVERCEATVLVHLRSVLRSFVLSEVVAGKQSCAYSDFVVALEKILQISNYDPVYDWRQSALLVGRLAEARGIRFKAVAILGLSEGVLPVVEHPDALFDESLRTRFGLDPRLARGQASLFYQAVTRADQHLLLTRPYLAKGGEIWEPSHYWAAVENIFPASKSRIKPDAPRVLHQAASREEALFWAIRQGQHPRSDPDLVARARWVEGGSQVLKARLSGGPQSPFEGCLNQFSNELSQIFNDAHIWSVTRLEVYGSCPFRFMVERLLALERKQPPELGFDARQLGTMVHAILEKAYLQAGDNSEPQAVLAILPAIASHEFEQAPLLYGFRPSPLWEAEKEQLLDRLTQTVIEMAQVSLGWVPVAFELAFGLPDQHQTSRYPPLELTTGIGKIKLHGFIDRLDRNLTGQFRVVDYKMGSSHLSRGDLLNGYRLQLPFYALAAQEACLVGDVVDGLYWSINQSKKGLELGSFRCEAGVGLPAAISVACAHLERIIGGIRQGNFSPCPPKGGCPSYCAALVWCWHYEPGFGI